MEQYLLSKKSFHRLFGSWFAVMMLLFCAGNAAAQIIFIKSFKKDNIIYTVTGANTVRIISHTTSFDATTLDLPSVVNEGTTYSVTGIGDGAFSGNSTLTYVNLPYVKTIGSYAFMGCTSLKTLKLPEVTTIYLAFIDGCDALKSLTLPNLTTMDAGTFSGCKLDSLTMNAIDSIPDGGFYTYPASTFTYVNLPNTKIIGFGAFQGCVNLKTLNLPEVTTVHGGFISNCTALKSLTLPKVTTMDPGTFSGCELESLTMNVIETIPDGAFSNSTKLTYVNLPKAKTIGNIAFNDCEMLEILSLGATPPSVADGAFDGCPSHRNLILVAADGTALTGAALNAAIMNYRNHAGYDVRTNLWYGWTLPELERNIAYATISLENGSFQANGSQFKPGVAVSFYGMPLTEGVDYTVTYGENINPGKGTVIITGVGNYPGSQTITFTIYAKPVYVIIPKVSDVTVTPGFGLNLAGIGQPFEFTVTPDSVLGKEGTDYTIEVRTDKGETLYPNGNSYKIAAVDHETTVYINVKKLHPTGVDNINALIVYGGQGSITIESPNNTKALVINLFGRVIESTTISSGKTTFNGLSEGIYIVKIGNRTEKVIVR